MEPMRHLLDLLADGACHSGQSLGDSLGMTRAGVWKLVQRCNDDFGIGIATSGRRGYHLDNPVEWLDASLISSFAGTCASEASLCVFESISSTNDVALRFAQDNLAKGEAWVAEHQTSGRGRRGRSWASGVGRSICLSVATRIVGGAHTLEGFSLAVGIHVVEALVELGISGLELKWPNDVLRNGAKVGGILVEIAGDPLGDCNVVVGVGLNYRAPVLLPETAYPVAGILDSGVSPGRNEVCGALILAIRSVMAGFASLGFRSYRARWDKFDCLIDRPVLLLSGSDRTEGVARGVSDRGALLLESGGGVQEVFSGEVSVRRI